MSRELYSDLWRDYLADVSEARKLRPEDVEAGIAALPERLRAVVRERRDYHWAWDGEGGWHFNYIERYENTETREISVALGSDG